MSKCRTKLPWLVLILLLPLCNFAQQDPMYSQYMFNGLAVNPAYAGSRDAISLAGLYRQQWWGFSGAPVTQTLTAHMPSFNRRHGFGVSIVNDRASYLGQTWLNVDYAYRIPFGQWRLAFGLRGTVNQYRIGWEDADLKDRTDIVAINYPARTLLPNAGFGIYLNSDNFYAGIGIPRLLVNVINSPIPEAILDDGGPGRLRRHFFGTVGAVLRLGEGVQLKPSIMGKYVNGAPAQADFNLNVYFKEKLGVGASYRTGDALVGLVDFFFTPQLHLGYAFGYPTTSLAGYSAGSHELLLGYDFKFKKDGVASPRLF